MHWCKYCKIFITDNKPSRQQHETGLKHKGNVERSLKNLYKQGAKEKKDAVKLANELAKIDGKAMRSMGPIHKVDPSKIVPVRTGKIDASKYSQPGLSDAEQFEIAQEYSVPHEAKIGQWEVVKEAKSTTLPLPTLEQPSDPLPDEEDQHRGFQVKEKTHETVLDLPDTESDAAVTFKKRKRSDKGGQRKLKKEGS